MRKLKLKLIFTFAVLSCLSGASHAQVACNEVTGRQIHADWQYGVLDVKPDDVSLYMGVRAKLCGNLKHVNLNNSSGHTDPWSSGSRFRDAGIYGWKDTTNDKMVFSVDVPTGKAGTYDMNIIFDGDGITSGNVFSVRANSSTPSGTVIPVGASAASRDLEVRYNRIPMSGTINLLTGVNHIEIKLSSISSAQITTGTSSSTSAESGLRIHAVELVKSSLHPTLKAQGKIAPPDLDWYTEKGTFGLFVHHSTSGTRTLQSGTHVAGGSYNSNVLIRTDWNNFINDFDVQTFVDAAEGTGASYVVWTIFHGLAYYPGPSTVIDNLISGRTATRDLIKDVGNELEARGMRLALYFHSGKDDSAWNSASRYSNTSNKQIFNDNIIALHTEWASRYNGTNGYPTLASTGMYLDAWWQGTNQREFPYKQFIDAIKAPGRLPNAVMGFSSQQIGTPTMFTDVYAGDTNTHLTVPKLSIFENNPNTEAEGSYIGMGVASVNKLQANWPYKGGGWSNSSYNNIFTAHRLSAQVSFLNGFGGPVYFNAALAGDVRPGVEIFSPASITQLKSVTRKILNDLRPHIIDNTERGRLTYSGDWNDLYSTLSFHGTRSDTTDSNAFVEATFTGTTAKVYVVKTPSAGLIEVFIDGASQGSYNASSTNTDYQSKIFETTTLADGPHTIKLVPVTGKLHFDYIETQVTENPATVSLSGNSSNTQDDASSILTYTGSGWSHISRSGALNQTISYTKTLNSKVAFNFDDTALRIYTQKGPSSGIVEVLIDNVSQGTVDTYSATYDEGTLMYENLSLSPGNHTAEVRCTNTKNPSASSTWCHIDEFESFSVADTTTDDNNLGLITYTGNGWSHISRSGALNQTISYTNTLNSKAAYAFNGTGIKIHTQKGPSSGIVEVLIDNVSQGTVDTYAATYDEGALMYENINLSSGNHTVEVRCTNTKNPSASGTWCHVDQFNALSIYSPEIDNTSTNNLVYEGTWSSASDSGAIGGTISSTNAANASVDLPFNASHVKVFGKKAPDGGIVDIYIDGRKVKTIDTYSSSTLNEALLYENDNLVDQAIHNITIVNTGTSHASSTNTYFHFDAIDISN